MAVLLWNILFTGAQTWKFLDDWIDFVQETHKRPVMQDTWSLLHDFRRVRFELFVSVHVFPFFCYQSCLPVRRTAK
jgi:hypothetical protein